jgi:hypothetical protein
MDAVEHGLVYSTSHDVHKGTLTHAYTPTDSKNVLHKNFREINRITSLSHFLLLKARA